MMRLARWPASTVSACESGAPCTHAGRSRVRGELVTIVTIWHRRTRFHARQGRADGRYMEHSTSSICGRAGLRGHRRETRDASARDGRVCCRVTALTCPQPIRGLTEAKSPCSQRLEQPFTVARRTLRPSSDSLVHSPRRQADPVGARLLPHPARRASLTPANAIANSQTVDARFRLLGGCRLGFWDSETTSENGDGGPCFSQFQGASGSAVESPMVSRGEPRDGQLPRFRSLTSSATSSGTSRSLSFRDGTGSTVNTDRAITSRNASCTSGLATWFTKAWNV